MFKQEQIYSDMSTPHDAQLVTTHSCAIFETLWDIGCGSVKFLSVLYTQKYN